MCLVIEYLTNEIIQKQNYSWENQWDSTNVFSIEDSFSEIWINHSDAIKHNENNFDYAVTIVRFIVVFKLKLHSNFNFH